MIHPTIEQLDFVIEKLKSVLPQASKEDAFDMGIGHVYSDGRKYNKCACGIIHCTGGWYAVANLGRKFIKSKYDKGFIQYEDGAKLMAMDLGFESIWKLQTWAHENSGIWGNTEGYGLFLNWYAYNSPGYDGVVKQFEIVRSNLMKLKGSLA